MPAGLSSWLSGGRGKRRRRRHLFRSAAAAPTPQIANFYGIGPGQIATHFSTLAVEREAGAITRLRNLGGAGSVFDAVRSGSEVPEAGSFLDFSRSTNGYFEALNTIDLNGVRLIYAMRLTDFISATRWFGAPGFEFRSNPSETQGWFIQVWSNLGGTPGAGNILTARLPNDPQAVLVEHEFPGNGRVLTSINGVAAGNVALPSSLPQPGPVPLRFIGRGNGPAQFAGMVSDALGVILGEGADAATAAARAYIAGRAGITLT